MVPSGLGGEPLRVRRHPRMVRARLQREVQRDLQAELLGGLDEALEVLDRAQLAGAWRRGRRPSSRSPTASRRPTRRRPACCSGPLRFTSPMGGSAAGRRRRSRGDARRQVLDGVLERAVAGGRAGAAGSLASSAPIERGKNSYHDAVQRPWPIDPERVLRRAGHQFAQRVLGDEPLQILIQGRGDPMRDVEGGVAQRRGRGERPRALASGSVWASRSNSRAPVSKSLASSSAPWPASIFTVTAWCQVENGSPRPRRRTSTGRPVGDDGGVPAVGARRARVTWRPVAALRPSGSASTTLAPTASCPSRKTLAEIGHPLADHCARGELRGLGGADHRADIGDPRLRPRPTRSARVGLVPATSDTVPAVTTAPKTLAAVLSLWPVKALRRLTVRAAFPPQLAKLERHRQQPALVVAPGLVGPVGSRRPGAVAGRATATRAGCSARSARSGCPARRRPQVPPAAGRRARRPHRLPDPAAVVPAPAGPADGAPAERDRLLLARVRHHRGAAAVLRRPRHPRR